MSRFYFVLFAIYFFGTAILLFLSSLILLPFCLIFDPNRHLLHKIASAWGYHFVLLNRRWRCHFLNKSNFDASKTYVVVANHQSIADTFVLSGLFKPYKWVSKESLFKLPFFGWNMYLTRYIPIKRGDAASIKKMMNECATWLRNSEPILMFPEGTRSDSGELGLFRNGAFKLAIDNKVPVLPVVIHGTRAILPKHGDALAMDADVTVSVLQAVEPAQFDYDMRAFKSHVHRVMQNALSDMRAPQN